MTDFVNVSLLPLIEHFKSYANWIAFAAAFGETVIGIGFLLPGSTFMLILGVLAGQGYIDIRALLLFAVAGAYFGDITNYHLGRRYGRSVLTKHWLHLSNKNVISAERFVNTHGAKSVFFARFLPGLKETVPFLAGALKMRRDRFLFWDLFGAVGWSLEFVGIGYLFSASLALAQAWASRTIAVLTILFFLLSLLWLLKRFIQNNAQAAINILRSLWNSFLQNAYIKKAIESHPKSVGFIRARFNTVVFEGLPLTLFTLAFLYVLALFSGIIEDFVTRDPIVYADRIFANLMVQWRTPDLTLFFTWITFLGKYEVVLAFLSATVIILLLYRKYRELIALFVSLSGSVLFLYLGKLAFHRARPETALYLEPTYSFPSGHATIAVAFYGFVGYLLMRRAQSFKTKLNLFFATSVLILMIGLSRLYLGVHYLSDIYAGYLLGTLWVILAMTLMQWLASKKRLEPGAPWGAARSISSLIAAAAVLFYGGFGMRFHYDQAEHPKLKPLHVEDIRQLFTTRSDRFAYDLIGFKAGPINLLLTVNNSPCELLKQGGWNRLSNLNDLSVPMFWHAKKPLCSLHRHVEKRDYRLRIWDAGARYRQQKIYTANITAVEGYRWSILPCYVKDIDNARDFARLDFKKQLPAAHVKALPLNPPFIANRLFEQTYFSDGSVLFISIPDQKVPQ